MTITFYINWKEQEIYRNDKALMEGYLDYHGGAEMHFNEYLGEEYEPNTLFNATEKKKKEILDHYNTITLENARDWAKDWNMITTIEV